MPLITADAFLKAAKWDGRGFQGRRATPFRPGCERQEHFQGFFGPSILPFMNREPVPAAMPLIKPSKNKM